MIYIGNGYVVWEVLFVNVLLCGDWVVVLVNGCFGYGWGEVVDGLCININVEDFGMCVLVDFDCVVELLKVDFEYMIKVVMMVYVDILIGVKFDVVVVWVVMDKVGYFVLLMVDCIVLLGCDEYCMDDWGVDVMVLVC